MRKLLLSVLSAAMVASFAFSGPANAFCFELTNFCDDVDADFDGAHLYGQWDIFCGGDFPQPAFGPIPTMGIGLQSLIGQAADFKFNFGSRLFNLSGWDGVNPPFFFQTNQPFTITGVCNGPVGAEAGMSSTGH